jgi:hypothetical protein
MSAPRGTRGTVVVPLRGRARTIHMDGRVVWRAGRAVGRVSAQRDGDSVRFTGVRGRHPFAWRADSLTAAR